jgi:hypothetical protein
MSHNTKYIQLEENLFQTKQKSQRDQQDRQEHSSQFHQQEYHQAPPVYESESAQPFLAHDEEDFGDDMMKETVANSSVEIRMRKVSKTML